MGSVPDADLASLLECPVCSEYVLPPILQCCEGHFVCSVCRPKLHCCPTCRGSLGKVRNLAMEKIANMISFPCKYTTRGCPTLSLHSKKAEHEVGCEYQPFICPMPHRLCKWQGEFEEVIPHLKSHKKSIATFKDKNIVFLAENINLAGHAYWETLQFCHGHNFLLVLQKYEEKRREMFFASVTLLGSRKQAENFAYRMELKGGGRRLCWEGIPRSIQESASSVDVVWEGLKFPKGQAQLFAKNGELSIDVAIEHVETLQLSCL